MRRFGHRTAGSFRFKASSQRPRVNLKTSDARQSLKQGGVILGSRLAGVLAGRLQGSLLTIVEDEDDDGLGWR